MCYIDIFGGATYCSLQSSERFNESEWLLDTVYLHTDMTNNADLKKVIEYVMYSVRYIKK